MVRFYNKRGTAEQWIKEGKQAVKMTRLSCHLFRSSEVRVWLWKERSRDYSNVLKVSPVMTRCNYRMFLSAIGLFGICETSVACCVEGRNIKRGRFSWRPVLFRDLEDSVMSAESLVHEEDLHGSRFESKGGVDYRWHTRDRSRHRARFRPGRRTSSNLCAIY